MTNGKTIKDFMNDLHRRVILDICIFIAMTLFLAILGIPVGLGTIFIAGLLNIIIFDIRFRVSKANNEYIDAYNTVVSMWSMFVIIFLVTMLG
jgi:hypothetical protein